MSVSLKKVVIIIPTYHEALTIEETIQQIFAETTKIVEFEIQILVFDSASTDGTQEIVRQLISHYPGRLYLQCEAYKTGLGSAYLQAMRYALGILKADIIIEFDADLSHQPKYLLPMLERLQTDDVVLGSRYIQGGSIPKDWAWYRKFLSVLGNYVVRLVLTRRYRDFTSGFRATRRSALINALPENFLSTQYAYKLHLLWSLHKHQAKISEIPIEFVDRELGVSKLPTNSMMDALRVIFILRGYELRYYLKMCLVGLSGAVLQFIIYNLLRIHVHCPPIYAIKISTLFAIINNFILNHHFTFKQANKMQLKKTLQRFGLFFIYCLMIIQLQGYIFEMAVKYFGEGRLFENLLLVCVIGCSSLFNYLVASRWIWRVS